MVWKGKVCVDGVFGVACLGWRVWGVLCCGFWGGDVMGCHSFWVWCGILMEGLGWVLAGMSGEVCGCYLGSNSLGLGLGLACKWEKKRDLG